ncbi:MAG: lysophospholipid acyltransferase family protein [Bacteriovorax sp.]|nr:lysophospholipid acyltransferase family protein [Rhizobacter sp.]
MLTLFRWLSHTPLWFLHRVGALLGWLTYWASPSYRRRFHENAVQAGIDPATVRPAIASAGHMVAELPFLWLRPASEPIRPRLEWQGEALLEAALRARRGVLLLTPHMGSFEVTAQAIAQRFAAEFGAITVLYRPARKAALRRVMDEARARPGVATAPATLAGVRQMIRALRRGEAVGLLPDQVPPVGMGVWVPFFGKPAYTMTLAARLVQQTGAVPLLIWGERLAHGAGYKVHVSALGEALPRDDPGQAESSAVINRAMERLIRQCPQQYLWGYNRYKTPRSAEPAASDRQA